MDSEAKTVATVKNFKAMSDQERIMYLRDLIEAQDKKIEELAKTVAKLVEIIDVLEHA